MKQFSLKKSTYEPLLDGLVWQTGAQLNGDASIEVILNVPFMGYNAVRVYNNGFITFGVNNGTFMPITTKSPISNTVKGWACDYVFSAFGGNLCASNQGTPQISFGYKINNDFVIQYQDLAILNSPLTRTTFQIVLKTDGTVQYVYGGNLVGQSGAVSPQVGYRGKTELVNNIYTYPEWLNRKLITGDWNVLEENSNYPNNSNGTMPSSAMAWKDTTLLPNEGLTFEWK
jgi:hypothetical protein